MLHTSLPAARVSRARRALRAVRLLAGALAFVLLALPAGAQIQQLTTTYGRGNGQDGNMFDVKALNKDIRIKSFDVHFDQGTVNAEVHYVPHSYVGYNSTPSAWTLVGAVTFTVSTPLGVPQPLPLAIDIVIPAGQTYGFYVTSNGSGSDINYTNGTGIVYSNSDLEIYEGHGMSYPFGGNFNPRTWNGTVYYEPECQTEVFCSSKVNSMGCTPVCGSAGLPSMTAGSGFTISAYNVLPDKFGAVIYSTSGRNSFPYLGGTLCVNPPIYISKILHSGNSGSGACAGVYDFDFNRLLSNGNNPALQPGLFVQAQFMSRDPGFGWPNNMGLTEAMEFKVCP